MGSVWGDWLWVDEEGVLHPSEPLKPATRQGNVVALCSRHHAELHTGQKTFAAKYDIDLRDEARKEGERHGGTSLEGERKAHWAAD